MEVADLCALIMITSLCIYLCIRKLMISLFPYYLFQLSSNQLFNDIDNAEKLSRESLHKELNFQKRKIQMTNKEKEKRDSITSNPIKKRKKHFITER